MGQEKEHFLEYQINAFKSLEGNKINSKNKNLKIHEDRKWKLLTKNFRKIEDIKKEEWSQILGIIETDYGWLHPSMTETCFDLITKFTTQYLSLSDEIETSHNSLVSFRAIYYQGKKLKTFFSIEMMQDLAMLHNTTNIYADYIYLLVDCILKEINPSYKQNSEV